jgi:dTMP kinase
MMLSMSTTGFERGLLIALEGIDGSGTSTQAELLVRSLNQEALAPNTVVALLTREPSDGVIGRLLRRVLAGEHPFCSKTIALLFAADRLEHFGRLIEPALNAGRIVVSDRYVYSSLAYQSVSDPERWVFEINSRAPSPDLTVYLRVSADTAASRRVARGTNEEIFDADQLQRKIAARYDELLGASAERATWRLDAAGIWRRTGAMRTSFGRGTESAMIDGEQTVDAIHQQLRSLLDAKRRSLGKAEKENESRCDQ